MDNIDIFLDDRKDKWLKEKVKKAKNEDEIQTLQLEATQKFALLNWLIDAAKRVGQLSMVSHLSKFTHPSAKNSPVIAVNVQDNDGYLRTGNVSYELDVLGNAAAMDVYKFLSLTLDDGKNVLKHLEEDTATIRKRIGADENMYQVLADSLLRIKENSTSAVTDSSIKQVYFPLDELSGGYHLLSILTPSGLVTELKKRIDEAKFSEKAKLAREARKKNIYSEYGYEDIPDLTVTAYGGSKPQNISVLNNKNAGRAYLLSSVPPTFEKRIVNLPTADFFKNSVPYYACQSSINYLVHLIKIRQNNVEIRDAIKQTTSYIVDELLQFTYAIREAHPSGWSSEVRYQYLPKSQRIWLDDANQKQRLEHLEWLDDICLSITRWLTKKLEAKFKKGNAVVGLEEFQQILDWVKETIQDNKKGLL